MYIVRRRVHAFSVSVEESVCYVCSGSACVTILEKNSHSVQIQS